MTPNNLVVIGLGLVDVIAWTYAFRAIFNFLGVLS